MDLNLIFFFFYLHIKCFVIKSYNFLCNHSRNEMSSGFLLVHFFCIHFYVFHGIRHTSVKSLRYMSIWLLKITIVLIVIRVLFGKVDSLLFHTICLLLFMISFSEKFILLHCCLFPSNGMMMLRTGSISCSCTTVNSLFCVAFFFHFVIFIKRNVLIRAIRNDFVRRFSFDKKKMIVIVAI